MHHAVPSVKAPWLNLRIQNRRLPFIIDAQGMFFYKWDKNGEPTISYIKG
jgi:hypothetical protein